MAQLPFTASNTVISVVIDNEIFTISSDNKNFQRLKEELKKPEHDTLAIYKLASRLNAISSVESGNVTVKNGAVLYKGDVIDNTLTHKLLALIDEGFDAGPWLAFMDNLMQNPSFNSRKSLYDFLSNFSAPITEDGCFIAFKRVKKDFKDIHSGKFDNSPGKVVKMNRNEVDDNSSHTCSSGLHVAASVYLDSYANTSNSKTVMVKVNPANVVAVPHDYNFSKMRVCEYTVLHEIDPSKIAEEERKVVYK